MAGNKTDEPCSVLEGHIEQVFVDPDFVIRADTLRKSELVARPASEVATAANQLARDFGISLGDVRLYLLPIANSNRKRTSKVRFDPKTGYGTISFQTNTSQAELLEVWRTFERTRDKLFPRPDTRRRMPETMKLLYCVWKARKQQGLSFPEVYRLYSAGELPGYKGNPNQFSHEESLERHYRKYYPNDEPDT